MSFFLNAIKDYVYPATESDASSADPNATTPESAPSSNPYSSSTASTDRIVVQPPSFSLSVPSISLNSLQPPTITASSDSDDEQDSDDEKIQKTPSLQVTSSPYAASAAAAASVVAGNPTPSMTLSTAEDPDGMTYSQRNRQDTKAQHSNSFFPE